MLRLIILSFLLLIMPLSVTASEFASSSEEMLDQLTKPPVKKKKIKFKTRGSAKADREKELRGLKRVKTVEGSVQIMNLPPAEQSVNLKVEFDVDSYSIRLASLPLLDELGKTLNNPSLLNNYFIVGGHTDSDGSDEYNLELSLNRAKSVKSYLTHKHNINPSRLKIVGYGETSPIDSNDSSQGKQRNRRVEVLKLK